MPIFDAAGQVVANVSLTVPTFRFQPRDEPVFVRALAKIASTVSEALGSTISHHPTPSAKTFAK